LAPGLSANGVAEPEIDVADEGAVAPDSVLAFLREQGVKTYIATRSADSLAEIGLEKGEAMVHVSRPGGSPAETVLIAHGEAFVRGVPIDWPGVLKDSGGRRVDLPTYPFQRKRYWLYPVLGAAASTATSAP
jgi:acyl transferase domain-containing protein